MRTRVKFCGMTRPGDVRLASELGVDAMGFVFAPNSKRQISADIASQIRLAAGPFVHIVALFMNNKTRDIEQIIRVLRPHLLQFHGDETESECNRYGLPYMKSLPMAEGVPAVERMALAYPSARAFLLDAHAAGMAGGTGQVFDWSAIPKLSKPWVLAGGLTADNVTEALKVASPFAVDVSSGIESAPGIKDGIKMRKFLQAVSRVHANNI